MNKFDKTIKAEIDAAEKLRRKVNISDVHLILIQMFELKKLLSFRGSWKKL